MQKGSGTNLHTVDSYWNAEVKDVGVRMRYCYASCKQLHANSANRWQLSDGSVANVTHTTQCLEDCGMHISHKCSTPRLFVDIFEHQDSGPLCFNNSGPEVSPIMKERSRNRRVTTAQATSQCITDRWGSVGKHASNLAVGETRVAQSDAELFDRVCDHAGIELTKSTKLLFSQQRCTCHLASSRASCFSELSASIYQNIEQPEPALVTLIN